MTPDEDRRPGAHAPDLATSATSRRIIMASAPYPNTPDCVLDGFTDTTAGLQARLDALEALGGGSLVIDGPAAVTGLRQPSGTTIDGFGIGSLTLLAGSGSAIVTNKHPRMSATGKGSDPWSTIVDHDIRLRDIRVDGNRRGGASGTTNPRADASGVLLGGLEYFGVRNLILEDVEVYDACCFGIWVANVDRYRMVRVRVHVPQENIDGATHSETTNQDGIHINGAARDGYVHEADISSADDALALNADDGHQVSEETMDALGIPRIAGLEPFLGKVSWGPITRFTCDGLFMRGCLAGPRTLAAISDISDVVIRHVRGTYRWYGMLISDFGGMIGTGGVTKNVLLDDWEVSAPDSLNHPHAAHVVVSTTCDSVVLRNHRVEKIEDDQPFVRVFDAADIQSLEIDGFTQNAGEDRSPVQILGGSTRIGVLYHRGVNRLRLDGTPYASPLVATFDGAIVEREVDGDAKGRSAAS